MTSEKVFLVKTDTKFLTPSHHILKEVELTYEELLFIKRCLEDCESEFAKNLLKKLEAI